MQVKKKLTFLRNALNIFPPNRSYDFDEVQDKCCLNTVNKTSVTLSNTVKNNTYHGKILNTCSEFSFY